MAMKSTGNGVSTDAVIRVEFDNKNYFFSEKDFIDVGVDFNVIKGREVAMKFAIVLIFQNNLGLTWNILQ
jgi:hypothetical protein